MKLFAIALAAASTAFAQIANAQDVPPLTSHELAFSVENMDTTVDPRIDFAGYAAELAEDCRSPRPASPYWSL